MDPTASAGSARGCSGLFTNIPLEESIDLAVSYITQYANTTFSAKELKDLFHIATAQFHFF